MTAAQLDRPRFYEQQYLGAADLEAVIDYGRIRLARHELGGHTWGIAMGLALREVPSTMPNQMDIIVTPGYAWDGFGRPIVMLAPCLLSPSQFQFIRFDPAVPNGTDVPVWIRYDETLTGEPQAFYDACDAASQFSRVAESYRVEVGLRPTGADRANIDVAGQSIPAADAFQLYDKDNPQKPFWDASVPHQTLPEDDRPHDWLVQIGVVHWTPDPAPANPGVLSLATANPATDQERSRRYAGAIAGTVLPPGANVRMRGRKDAPSAVLSDDLVWVEGKLRIDGGARLFGCPLDLLTSAGLENNALFRLERSENNALGGRDLRVQIGTAQAGTHRLVIGSKNGAAQQESLVVLDSGLVGVNIGQPQVALHINGAVRGSVAQNNALHIDTGTGYLDVGCQNGGWAHFYTGNPRFYFNKGVTVDTGLIGSYDENLELQTSGTTRLTALTNTGYVGIGTTAPLDILHVARGNHLNAVFENNTASEHLTLVVGTGGSGLRFSNTNEFFIGTQPFANRADGGWGSPELLRLTATGNMGLGTSAPRSKLEVDGAVRLGTNGDYFAPGCLNELRFIVGKVSAGGARERGTGFTASRNATGDYTVTYDTPFTIEPVVLVTPFDPLGHDNTMNIITSNSNRFNVVIKDTSDDDEEDDSFNFIALGPM